MQTPNGSAERSSRRRATMADVAHRAGVSRTLVSLIFSDKPGASTDTRDRVLRAADELAYQPDRAAQLLARGRSRTLGVLTDVKQTFQAEMIGTVYDAAEAAGYEVLLSASGPTRDERKAIEALLSHRCEGLILFNPLSESTYLRSVSERAVLTIVGRKVPVHPGHSAGSTAGHSGHSAGSTAGHSGHSAGSTAGHSGHSAGSTPINTVRSADNKGIRQSVDHLVALGHRAIVHVDGGEHSVSIDRRRAYVESMRTHGLEAYVRVIPGAHDEAAGAAAVRLLLDESDLPTAVLAGNDRSALGVMDELTKAGVSIPGHISIVGYDDSPLSSLSRIDLTTVRQDSAELARKALEFTVTRLEGDSLEAYESVIEPHLVVRGTTGPPRTHKISTL